MLGEEDNDLYMLSDCREIKDCWHFVENGLLNIGSSRLLSYLDHGRPGE